MWDLSYHMFVPLQWFPKHRIGNQVLPSTSPLIYAKAHMIEPAFLIDKLVMEPYNLIQAFPMLFVVTLTTGVLWRLRGNI